ncbi:hypothetical protein [Blastococcus tunisiensis]|uniref:NACHT domain-containing protein n=1 Tax=Blastococcus tunisiensis TaxID=1798228 RepID=A0A1I2EIU9_9ACTN|nr:hypothetical protein [Blastococcus sp. DSM 46838]SFE92170.1 hypothetical protein SAMN05216574_10758 [Blastococcus sp. DSM 46838]
MVAFLLTRTVGLEAADRWASVIGATAAVMVAIFGLLSRWFAHRSATVTTVDRDAARDDVLGVVHARRVQLQSRLVDLSSPLPVPWSLASSPDQEQGNDAYLPSQGVVKDLAEALATDPPRGLVILGDRGAGKSTVADLALIRADARSEGGISPKPVPFRIHISSWDPREDLVSWAGRQIRYACSQADVEVRGGARVIRSLIERGDILLVLDGFDEFPETYGHVALERIRTAGLKSFILLSRPDAYFRAGSGLDLVADVVVLGPLSRQAASHELSRGTAPHGAELWPAVAHRVLTEPESVVGTVLRWPLFLWLAVRLRSEGLPPPLALENNSYAPEAVEGALLEGMVIAAYGHGFRGRSASDLLRARRYFRTLSKAMAARGREDFVWWDLEAVIPWGIQAAVGGSLTYAFVHICLERGLGWNAGASTLALLATLILASTAASRAPRGSRWRGPVWRVAMATAFAVPVVSVLEGGGPVWNRLVQGFWIGLAAALLLLLLASVASVASDDWRPAARWLAGRGAPGTPRGVGWHFTFPKVVVPAVLGLLLDALTTEASAWGWGLAMFALVTVLGSAAACFGRPVSIAPSDRPATAVRSNLLFAFVASLLWCTAFLAPTLLFSMSQAWSSGRSFAWPEEMGVGLPPWLVGIVIALVIFIGLGALCSVVGLTVCSAGRFLVAGSVLALVGRWPWPTATFRFLRTAHTRGILRQVGPAHTFAHVAFRETVAGP